MECIERKVYEIKKTKRQNKTIKHKSKHKEHENTQYLNTEWRIFACTFEIAKGCITSKSRYCLGIADISAREPLGPGPLDPCLRTTRTVSLELGSSP